MIIRSVKYLKSCVDLKNCPFPDKAEFAFVGRSNVGKSSLINMLTNRKKLAAISSTPGKTKTINYFIVNEKWYLVDLPGYGYAKTGKKQRELFAKIITNYIFKRISLINLFVLVDARIPPQKIDLQFINNLGENQIPFSIVLTKTDKLSKTKIENFINDYKKILSEKWEQFPHFFITSSVKGTGRNDILNFIEKTIPLYKPNKVNLKIHLTKENQKHSSS